MTVVLTPLAPAEAIAAAMHRLDLHLDLSMIRMKLGNPDEGEGARTEDLDRMEQEYRRFLALQLAYPDSDVVPCKLVDDMWHRHILDTAAYRVDCEAIFGRFLDHYPYFGMCGDQDAQDLEDAYADTLGRYRHAFGEPPVDTWISPDVTARCRRTACKPQRCK